MDKNLIIPEHIAIILDGNRRWAKKRGLPTLQGHTKGADNLEKIARYCNSIGVKYLTVYCFSTENWKRTQEEVDYLMKLLAKYVDDFEKKFGDSNARIKLVGDINRLPDYLQDSIKKAIENTKKNTGLSLFIAFNYEVEITEENSPNILPLATFQFTNGLILFNKTQLKNIHSKLFTFDTFQSCNASKFDKDEHPKNIP